MYELLHYVTASGSDLVETWMSSLKDRKTEARIAARIARLAVGNFGDCKPLSDGVWELRIDHGPGFSVDYTVIGKQRVLLLCGGDKRRQPADIERAVTFWNDYQKRTDAT